MVTPYRFGIPRPLGLTYLVLFLLFMALRAKFYFLSPVYPFLFAVGAVWLEQAVSKLAWHLGASQSDLAFSGSRQY